MQEESITNGLYLSDVYSKENFDKTRKYVSQKLLQIRKQRNIDSQDDICGIPSKPNLLPDYREVCLFTPGLDDITEFVVPLCKGDYTRERRIWVLKQMDGYSCAASSIFTCTGGHTRIPPFQIAQTLSYVTTHKMWEPTGNDANMPDLPMEAMPRVTFDTMGILPTMIVGIVSSNDIDGNPIHLDDNDDLFNDEDKFVKLMLKMRTASLTSTTSNHWISLVCIPVEEKTMFMVFDSLSHISSMLYENYRSLRKNFFPMISNCNGDFESTVLMCIYPMLRTRVEDHVMDTFSRDLLDLTIENIKTTDIAVTAWKDVRRTIELEDTRDQL